MQNRKTLSVYILLGVAWLLFAGWQWLDHERFKKGSEAALLERARATGKTLSVVIRSQGRFGMLWQPRLEEALNDLAKSNKIQAVMLLNAANEVVASAGTLIDVKLEDLPNQEALWSKGLVAFYDLVALGGSAQNQLTSAPLPIVLNEGVRPPEPPRRPRDEESPEKDAYRREDPEHRRRPPGPPGPPWMGDRGSSTSLSLMRAARQDPNSTAAQFLGRPRGEGEGDRPDRPGRRPQGFRRLPWIAEEHFRELQKEKGLHGFVLQMPTETCAAAVRYDLWIRMTTLTIALLAVGGVGFAWRNMERMNRLQLRLLRASEMNAHLQELNVAAAGLAHETRNPLNIVRGLAQLIAQNPAASDAIRQKSNEITAEVDRVTGRLNEFINYSRTPEPRPGRTNLLAVARDVARALESDLADKAIHCAIRGPELLVEADESLLRQVFFNLLLNAIQAVGHEGRIDVAVQTGASGEAFFEVQDNGPGVPAELRMEIFTPYFSTRPEGTGLGLAVVRQIVLAHHWEIEYLGTSSGGANFRVSGVKVL